MGLAVVKYKSGNGTLTYTEVKAASIHNTDIENDTYLLEFVVEGLKNPITIETIGKQESYELFDYIMSTMAQNGYCDLDELLNGKTNKKDILH